MLQFSLVLNRKSDQHLSLTMSLGFRVLFIAITLFILIGMLVVQVFTIFPLLILAISFLASIYNEAWTFDTERDLVEHRIGVLFLFKRITHSISEIDCFELKSFVRGTLFTSSGKELQSEEVRKKAQPFGNLGKSRSLPPQTYNTLTMYLNNGTSYNIETIKTRYHEEFERKAEEIAEFVDKPLVKE
jgi:hypothetical protein